MSVNEGPKKHFNLGWTKLSDVTVNFNKCDPISAFHSFGICSTL